MISRIAPAIVAVCVFALPLAAQELKGRDGTTYTWSERLSAGQWLRVYGPNGRINVTEASGDVAEVVGEKDLRRGRAEDIGYEIRKTSDGYTICAFPVGGGVKLEGLVEAFNLTNRANPLTRNSNFGPGAYPTNPVATFNQITAVGDPRIFQFGLRLTF